MKRQTLRTDGRAVEALLILLKNLTAHARWVFAVLLLLYAISGIRTIQPQEQALVLRFGRLQPEVHGPGLLPGLPEPFDRVLRFETGKDVSVPLDAWSLSGSKIQDPDKQRTLSNAELENAIKHGTNGGAAQAQYDEVQGKSLDPVYEGYTITKDFNIIQGRFLLRYRIETPFLYASSDQNIDALLSRMAYRALSCQLAERKIDEALTSERGRVAETAAREVQKQSELLQLGVRVSGIDIRELSPSSQVLAAFEDVVNARQFAKTLYENSRQYQAETQAKAEGEAASILHRAGGVASGIVSASQGETVAFSSLLASYQLQPELVSSRLLRESLDTVMSRIRSRTLLPSAQSQPSLLMEPLPETAR